MQVRPPVAIAFAAILLGLLPWASGEEQSAEKTTKKAEAKAARAERAEKKERDKLEFVRIARDDDDAPTALEVAVVRFAPLDCGKDGPIVDLIGAVHIGDKAYYDEINRLFSEYEAVLYEMVAPPEASVPPPGAEVGRHPVSFLQNAMTGVLDLEYQLRGIDYTAKNLVHADMSPEQFTETMRKRGESFLTMFLQMMSQAMAQQSSTSNGNDLQLLMALFSEDRAMALKRVLAEQFEDLETSMLFLEGENGSTIIAERNKVALNVLRKQLDAGKKKLAIFYGAGHMTDFAKRLRDEFKMGPLETRWLVAWDLE
jgi:hypothetical protein